MFLLSDIAEVRTGLENKQTVCKDKIKVLETSKEYLERSVKESENNLRSYFLMFELFFTKIMHVCYLLEFSGIVNRILKIKIRAS